MTSGRWHVAPCPGGWTVTNPAGQRIFYTNSLKIAHRAATAYADQDAAQIVAAVRAQFRKIVAHTWPAGLRDLIEADTRDQIVALGIDVDECFLSNVADVLQRMVENGDDE